MGETVTYEMPCAPETTGYLALPEGRGPAVVVLHEWWGLTEPFRRVCDRLAAEGFVALAPDYYHGATTRDPAEAARLRDALSEEAALSDVDASYDFVRRHAKTVPMKVALVGFSLGAALALRAARHLPVEAVVAYYGWIDPAEAASIRAPVQGHYGALDAGDTAADAAPLFDALRARGLDAEPYAYPGVGHAFANPDLPAYSAPAASLAWERTLRFLRARLL